ncbi:MULTISPECIES: branched-chain amino acid ABC transporter permease [Actinoalloteichus]|uniref:branched-chain amino acid ABC transporter permease n=1 Tax=Actinoalloteichus TaxID=65496 RepID=UPI0003FBFF66
MSEPAVADPTAPTAPRQSLPPRRPPTRALATAALLLALLVLPLYLPPTWMQTGLFAMAAAVGAIGLTLLSGVAGQLSLGHAFFLAVGAYGYAWASGEPGAPGAGPGGLGLPTWAAAVLAVLLAGIAGGLFSPIAGRLHGMYLGLATLALVFVGHQLLVGLPEITGGHHGRSVEPLTLGSFAFADDPPGLVVLGVPFGGLERLWYLGLVAVLAAFLVARNLVRGRPGRAFGALRDSPVAASVFGVSTTRFRAAAFVVSSMYAGLAGVLLALAFRRVVPDYFGLALSIDYLAMIIIGGLGSVGGAVAGAVFVTVLPQLLTQYSDHLPLVVAPGSGQAGVTPAELSRYLYGLAIVLVLLLTRRGLAGLAERLLHARSRDTPTAGGPTAAVVPHGPTAPEPGPTGHRPARHVPTHPGPAPAEPGDPAGPARPDPTTGPLDRPAKEDTP